MEHTKPSALPRGHARKFTDYFHVLNSGNEERWPQAFDDTWHPDAVVDGRPVTALRAEHHTRLGTGRTETVHVIREIDAYRLEYTSEINGKYAGPFVATFRDGRVYRVI